MRSSRFYYRVKEPDFSWSIWLSCTKEEYEKYLRMDGYQVAAKLRSRTFDNQEMATSDSKAS